MCIREEELPPKGAQYIRKVSEQKSGCNPERVRALDAGP